MSCDGNLRPLPKLGVNPVVRKGRIGNEKRPFDRVSSATWERSQEMVASPPSKAGR
jgi:hypothetical protein